MTSHAAEAKAARNRPTPVPQLGTQAEQMAFLVSCVQGMEKNIQEILQNQKSLERVVETKFHDMDVKVTELNTIVKQLQHELASVKIPCSDDDVNDDDDEESYPRTTTQFSTKPRYAVVPAPETRQTSSAQASAPSAPPPASTQAP
ncbi:nucleolysin tiar [Hordeum vulgare]|nr:nucleolysin tiar [Hordeum vulgare]